MTSAEKIVWEQCKAVVEYVNKNMGTHYELDGEPPRQLALSEPEGVIFVDTLREVDKRIEGILILTNTLTGRRRK